MKLDPRRADAFIANPGATRVVLFHGEDIGLAHDRANRLAAIVAGSSNDPFAVVDLERSSIDAVVSEISSLPMTGSRRVVRLRECADFAVDPMRRALSGDGRGLIIAEAGVLPPRSKLRTFVEVSDEGVAIACFPPDARDKAMLLKEILSAAGITLDEEALSWMSARAVDHATAMQEADKLVSFAGLAGTLTLEDVAACSGDFAAASLEEALFAATAGIVDQCDRALAGAIADGVAAIQVLRGGMQHLHRLTEIQSAVHSGVAIRESARSTGPPVPARRFANLEASLAIWTEKRLEIVAGHLLRAERACKRTGAPAEMIARDSVMRVSHEARARAITGRVFSRGY